VFGGRGVRYKFCLLDGNKHDSEAVIRPTYCRPAWAGAGGGGTFHFMDLLCMCIDFPSEITFHIDILLYQFLRVCVRVRACVRACVCVCVQLDFLMSR
jgi:hypothetical protein